MPTITARRCERGAQREVCVTILRKLRGNHRDESTECIAYSTVPAALAIRGHKSAHSLATGPEMAEPFMSPFALTITAALSSK